MRSGTTTIFPSFSSLLTLLQSSGYDINWVEGKNGTDQRAKVTSSDFSLALSIESDEKENRSAFDP